MLKLLLSWSKMLMERGRQCENTRGCLPLDLPVRIGVFLVGGNVPSMGVAGLDSYDPGSVLGLTLNVEVLLVVDVLKRPTFIGVLSLPLYGEVRIHP